MNQCIHGIDLFRWMLGGEVDTIYAQTRQQFHDYLECEDLGMAVVTFKNGAIGTIEGTTNVYPKNLEETEILYDKFIAELQKVVDLLDTNEFVKGYPQVKPAVAVGLYEGDVTYEGYKSAFEGM